MYPHIHIGSLEISTWRLAALGSAVICWVLFLIRSKKLGYPFYTIFPWLLFLMALATYPSTTIVFDETKKSAEKVKNILGSMIDPVVVQEAMVDLAALKRGSETHITAFFSDVASF